MNLMFLKVKAYQTIAAKKEEEEDNEESLKLLNN